jgi:ADP-L-glycero-D-manno-heptose 6-epimerase
MRIVVSGASGFIGGELIKMLNDDGYTDIIAIDSESKPKRTDLKYDRFIDWEFILENKYFDFLNLAEFVFHLGANSSTRATIEELQKPNLDFTHDLFYECSIREIPIVFSSSGAIYGSRRDEYSTPNPLTNYGKSKLQCEQMRWEEDMDYSNITCLRYHNVYGATESHKGDMASIVSKWIDNYNNGLLTNDLFHGSNKILRDFIHVNDVNRINIMLLDHYKILKRFPLERQGYDVGMGIATSFQDVANEIIRHTKGTIQYTINPYNESNYQFYTKANIEVISDIYKMVYNKPYTPLSISQGVELVFKEKTEKNEK